MQDKTTLFLRLKSSFVPAEQISGIHAPYDCLQGWLLENIRKLQWTTSRIILRITLPAATGTSFLNLSMVPGNVTGVSTTNQTYGTHVIVVICQDCHDPLWGPSHGALWRDLPRCAGDLASMVRSRHSQLHYLAMSKFIFAELLFSFVVSVMHAHLLELLQKPRGAWADFKLSVRNPQRGFTWVDIKGSHHSNRSTSAEGWENSTAKSVQNRQNKTSSHFMYIRKRIATKKYCGFLAHCIQPPMRRPSRRNQLWTKISLANEIWALEDGKDPKGFR